jgi:uncharacterized membrane protein YciS (DUF1049 family)
MLSPSWRRKVLSILLAIIATCCFIAMIISSLVAINLADKLERAEQKIQRLQAPQEMPELRRVK